MKTFEQAITHCVNLHFSNDEYYYQLINETASESFENAEPTEVLNKSESCRYDFSDWLKDLVYDLYIDTFESASVDPNCLLGDMLSHAIQWVDWVDLADTWLANVDGYERIE